MDPIFFRGIERLLIVLGAVFFGYLGYRLFLKGISSGEGNLNVQSSFGKIVLSGTGPGLFFMAFGAIVLVAMVVKGEVSVTESTTKTLRTEPIQSTTTSPVANPSPASPPDSQREQPTNKDIASPARIIIEETKTERKSAAKREK